MIKDKKVIQAKFDRDLQIVYSATLLSGNPSGILRFVSNYPVYQKDGDEDAVEQALNDLKLAMSHGKEPWTIFLSGINPFTKVDLQ